MHASHSTKATEERADDEKKLASVRQTLTELRKTAQERDAQIARLRELIAREESAVQLATSRAKDYASQRDLLTSQRDDAQQQLDALRSEADSIADDDGAALDAARATLAECRERLNELADKQREIQSKIISLKAKADALADTLGSRNASGSLERDTDVASLGRLTDFIHVAEGWEEAVAHALDQHASAIVVPEAGNMLHALERAREDKLGKAVVLTASIAGDPATEPGTESEESSAENTAAAPRSGNALAALVTANPDAKNPAQAEAVVHTVRLLLADVAMAGTADEAQHIVASGRSHAGRHQRRDLHTAWRRSAALPSLNQTCLWPHAETRHWHRSNSWPPKTAEWLSKWPRPKPNAMKRPDSSTRNPPNAPKPGSKPNRRRNL